MDVKKLLAASVIATFAVPAIAAAYTYDPEDYPNARETLVEGHTVFAVIQADICVDENNESVKCPKEINIDADVKYDIRANVTAQRLGAAVAVLVRDRVKEVPTNPIAPDCPDGGNAFAQIFYENPGVLWFNDQFLVGDDLDILEVEADANVDVCAKVQQVSTKFDNVAWRYPCGGWALATQAGNPDPREILDRWAYMESYFITDPNDHTWTIDKYGLLPAGANLEPIFQTLDGASGGHGVSNGTSATVPETTVGAAGAQYTADGTYAGGASVQDYSQAPWNAAGDSPHWMYYLGAVNMWSVPIMGYGTVDPGPTSGVSCDPHVDQAVADPYELPAVRYNAVLFFFFEDLATSYRGEKLHGNNTVDGDDISFCEEGTDEWDCADIHTAEGFNSTDDNEGNSHPYNSDESGAGPNHTHATASVDLYFSNVAPPSTGDRKYAVYDATGSGAPRHVHDPSLAFDDRMRIDPCLDADFLVEYSRQTVNGGGTYTTHDYKSADGEVRYGDGETMADGENLDDCVYPTY